MHTNISQNTYASAGKHSFIYANFSNLFAPVHYMYILVHTHAHICTHVSTIINVTNLAKLSKRHDSSIRYALLFYFSIIDIPKSPTSKIPAHMYALYSID